MNSMIIEYGGINIQHDGISMRIPYTELVKMNINDIKDKIFGLETKTFNVLKEFANYMIEKIEDTDVDLEKPIEVSWSDDIQSTMEQVFSVNMYEQMLSILKQEVELALGENLEGDE